MTELAGEKAKGASVHGTGNVGMGMKLSLCSASCHMEGLDGRTQYVPRETLDSALPGKPISHPTPSRARRELGMYFMFCVTKPWRASYFPTDVSGVV